MPTKPQLSMLKLAGRLKDLKALTWMLARCQPLLVLLLWVRSAMLDRLLLPIDLYEYNFDGAVNATGGSND
jgi:hypothetical protein